MVRSLRFGRPLGADILAVVKRRVKGEREGVAIGVYLGTIRVLDLLVVR